MKKEPLKDKIVEKNEEVAEDYDSKYYEMRYYFKVDDVRSAVEWLKKEIFGETFAIDENGDGYFPMCKDEQKDRKYLEFKDCIKLIDKAFEDVIQKEPKKKHYNIGLRSPKEKEKG